MTVRTRFWLKVAVVLTLLLVGLPAAGWWYLHSAHLRNVFSRAYAERLPGRLSIGRIEYPGVDRVILHDVAIDEGPTLLGTPPTPLLRAARVTATLALGDRRLTAVDLDGIHGHLDEANLRLLRAIIRAENRRPPSGRSDPLAIAARGRITFGGGAAIESLAVDLTTRGPAFAGTVTGTLDDHPLHAAIESRRAGGDPLIAIDLLQARLRIDTTLATVEELKLLKPLPAGLRPWLPVRIDAAGTAIVHNPGADTWDVAIAARWMAEPGGGEGRLDGQLRADQRTLTIANLRLADAGVGSGEGRLEADLDTGTIAIDLPRWQPGPRLPIPATVPTAAILAALPALHVEVRTRGEREGQVMRLTGEGRSLVELRFIPDAPLRVEADELPLTLAQPFLPAGVVVNGGMIGLREGAPAGTRAFRLTIADDGGPGAPAGDAGAPDSPDRTGVSEVAVSLRQGRFALGDWTFGPVDGEVRVAPRRDGSVVVEAILPVGTFSFAGGAAGGAVTAELKAMEALLARLHGPARLPELSGAASASVNVAIDGQRVRADIVRLALSRAGKADLVSGVDTTLRGSVLWYGDQDGRVDIRCGGQLVRGELLLFANRLNLAERTPIYTAAVTLRPDPTAGRVIEVDEVVVRAADASGQPQASGYSAQLSGRVLAASGTGTISGLVDHADLAWVSGLVSVQVGTISGDGAAVFSARLVDGSIAGIDGSVMPLSAELVLGRQLTATGLTGQVLFTVRRDAAGAADGAGMPSPASPTSPPSEPR